MFCISNLSDKAIYLERFAMKTRTVILVGILAGTCSFALPTEAKTKKDATSQPALTPDEQAEQTQKSAEGRADSIMKNLKIEDPAKAARVHDLIANEQVAIHEWHQKNDVQVKQLGKDGGEELDKLEAQRHALHDEFISKLSADLTPDQMEIVKEKLTGGQMMATYKAYPEIIPNLTDDEKAMILKTLKEGREEAMDAVNRLERIAIFKKYKGRINIYLDSHGHNVSQAYKDWGAAQKAKKNAAATQPA
jgi:hypothetical protein